MNTDNYYTEAVVLLKKIISTPSLSGEEGEVLDLIKAFFHHKKVIYKSKRNNIWVKYEHFDKSKPTILLNSHIDTVKPSKNYTNDPFTPIEKKGKLYGLGSNDAGGSLVALCMTFLYFNERKHLPYNLIFAATAEEEISGKNGISVIFDELPKVDLAIVGEPTGMDMAIAERGLIVLDCEAKGTSGHTARNEGVNAIYKAMKDIEWFRNYHFPKVSDFLAEVKMTVSQINAGYQHNVVPDICSFVIDVRTNEMYSNKDIVDIIKENVKCEVTPRSLRLSSSAISENHSIVQKGIQLGLKYYGSPTMSDQALMSFPSIKIGVGDSARSHIADEYIWLDEIKQGIEVYVQLLEGLKF